MAELIKLIVDLLVLRDSAKKGMFSWLVVGVGFGATVVVFAFAFCVIGYADKHPGAASDRLLLGCLIFSALTFIAVLIWGWRYQRRLAAMGENLPRQKI